MLTQNSLHPGGIRNGARKVALEVDVIELTQRPMCEPPPCATDPLAFPDLTRGQIREHRRHRIVHPGSGNITSSAAQ